VRRPRFLQRLNQNPDRKLTLVSAPAGFGKSALVTGWLAETDSHAAWISPDEGDNDPVRFWTYVIAAVQTVNEGVDAGLGGGAYACPELSRRAD
jgi:LuxR family maltose regulon positive regulatory protein